MKKEMLINVLQPEECRIAIVEDGILEELYVERTSHESYTGNIYKGKIVNLEPAIQAAFVDFSVGRNGFLHVSDVEPQYYYRHQGDEPGPAPRDPRRGNDDRRRPPREVEDRDPGVPPPPRSEDRPRDRDRPDRSERGRRDRSEPRRFGEGLVEEERAASSARPVEPPPRPVPEPLPERDEPRRARPEPPASAWPEEPAPVRPAEREPRPAEPDEPRGRIARPSESFDPDLPPSRTQRTRLPSAPPSPRAAEPEAPESARLRAPAEPADFAPEPRARRGRGRPARPPIESEPPLDMGPEPPAFLDVEPLTEAPIEEPIEAPRRRGGRSAIRSRGGEREAEVERPREPSVERPRGFTPERTPEPVERPRALIPERAPEPVERPRALIPERAPEPVERPRALIPERAPEPVERPRGPIPEERPRGLVPERAPEVEPERPRERERARGPEGEPPRGRARSHDRAGEPGYVPRRARSRSPEVPFGPAPPATPGFDWSDLVAEPETEADPDAAGDEAGGEAGKLDGPRRRRRRRGRRRERERPEGDASAASSAEDADSDFEDDDLESEPESGREAPALGGAEVEGATLLDEFDFGDEGEPDEFEEEAGDELHDEAGPAAPDEEIDPELEEEIRKEIAEIAELELEMGLRGTTEARPRRGDEPEAGRGGGRFPRGRGMAKPPIQEIFRRGDEVLVQVIKESIGTKGPTLSTYISIPGRYLVLMPGLNRVGVSRKIADEGQRRKLREIMNELNPPKGLGFIVRTAGLERTKRELARDLAYLLRLWKVILRRIKKARAPAPIYQESDMITRTIRDIFTSEIDTIWIDEPAAFERAQEFLKNVMPRFVTRLKLFDERVPLFHKYGIEDEIAKIQRRHVPLPEGGSIVIDQTEALVAIDVNSGNFRVENDAEKTAYEMNLRAAKEIARQLRLRDLGGVIVNDFIDMRDERHRRGVEKALRDAIKRDRARTKLLRMSAFGLIEMTRQRIRPSLKRSVYEDCAHCGGAGVAKTVESMSIDVMRLLALASHREDIRRINIGVAAPVAAFLNNRKRREIARIEAESNLTIHIRGEENSAAEHLQIDCFDGNNGEVRLLAAPAPPNRRAH